MRTAPPTRRLILRSGLWMTRRSDGKRERVRHDHTVIGLISTSPDGADCWCFRRGFGSATEYWLVDRYDVGEDDFPDDNAPSAAEWDSIQNRR